MRRQQAFMSLKWPSFLFADFFSGLYFRSLGTMAPINFLPITIDMTLVNDLVSQLVPLR
jgi:hypothetical protein